MGKRDRRRRREAGIAAPPPPLVPDYPDRLGWTGDYMVCRICNEPAHPYRTTADGGRVLYWLHPREEPGIDGGSVALPLPFGGYDHSCDPVPGNPIDADTVCDFCQAPMPRWVFVPRKPIEVLDVMTGILRNYSSPWACCDGCLPVAKRRDLTRLVNRALNSPHGVIAALPRAERRLFRKGIADLYRAYLASMPLGPYEQRIRNEPPAGPRGGRKGM